MLKFIFTYTLLLTTVLGFSQSVNCGDFFSDPNGALVDYTPGVTVIDTFYANPGEQVQLNFSELEISENDTIFLVDPAFNDFVLFTITADELNLSFTSISNTLILNFVSNNPIASAGWQGQVNCEPFDFMQTGIELDTLCEGFEGFVSWTLNIPLSGDVQVQTLLSDEFGSFDDPTAAGESFASDDSLYIQLPAGLAENGDYMFRFILNDTNLSGFVYEKAVDIRLLAHQPIIQGESILCGDTIILGIVSQFRVDYQWYLNDNLIDNETDTLLSLNQGGSYSIAAINECGAVFSSNFEVEELDAPTIPEILTENNTLCPGDAITINLLNGLDESELIWMDNQTMLEENVTELTVTSAGTYFAIRENFCGLAYSDTIDIIELSLPPEGFIETIGNTEFCEGSQVTLSVDSVPGFEIQWYNNTVPVDGGFSLDVNEEGSYYFELTNVCAETPSANQIEVTVLPQPVATSISAAGPTTLCEGNSVLLLVNPLPGNTVQWFLNDTPVDGSQNQISAGQSGIYTLSTSTSCGSIESTNSIEVQINPLPELPVIFTQGNPALCNGSNVNLFVSNQPEVNFVWKKNGSLVNSNTNSIVVTQPGVYTVTASNSCGTVNSVESVSITTGNVPQVPVIQANGPTTFCEGLSVNLQTTPQNGLVFSWLLNGNPVEGNNFSIAATQAGVYTLEVSNACDTLLSSNSITINLNPLPPAVQINPFSEQNLCVGESVQLSIPNIPGVSYQWKKDGDPVGQNLPSLTTSAEGEFTLTLANTCGVTPAQNTVIVNVDSLLPVTQNIIPQPGTALCLGGYVLLNAQPVPFQTYNWFLNGEPIDSQSNVVLQATAWGDYTVQASNACGISELSSPVTLAPGDAPQDFELYTTQGFEVCSNDSIAITAQVDFGVGIRWFRNNQLIVDGPAQIYVNEAGSYTAEAYNGCGEAIGLNSVTITVLQAPAVPVISLNGTALTSTAPGDLQWYNSALQPIIGENSQTYTPAPSNATYFLSVSNENGCAEFSEPFNYIVNSTANYSSLIFEVYPNPVSGELFVKNTLIEGELRVLILDATGRIIEQAQFTGPGTHAIQLNHLSKGIYFCRIIQNDVVLLIEKVLKS